MSIVEWCNANVGFTSSVLSVVGLILSMIAIVVSLLTARLPYKKRLLLGHSFQMHFTGLVGGKVVSQVNGIVASITNVGNRSIGISYLGYAIKLNGRLNLIYPRDRVLECNRILDTAERMTVEFYSSELLADFQRIKKNTKIYVYAEDSEGKVYKRTVGTAETMAEVLKDGKYRKMTTINE